MGMRKEDIVVVSIMPCTAKKFESAEGPNSFGRASET